MSPHWHPQGNKKELLLYYTVPHCYIHCLPYIYYIYILCLSINKIPHRKEIQWEKPSIP